MQNQSADQKKGILKTVAILVLIATASIGLFVNKLLTPVGLSKEELREKGVYLFEKPRLVKDFSLLDEKGNAFTKEELKGKWTLVFFGFTHCPDVCPTTLAVLHQFVEAMKQDKDDVILLDSTRVLLATVDPARDTPEVMGNYLEFFNPNFKGLTGEFMQVYNFATNLNAPFKKIVQGDDYTMDHSAYIFVLNDRGDYQGFIKPPITVDELMLKYPSIRQLYSNH